MRPIVFNTSMVRAILAGRKTVTRRAIKPQPFAVRQDKNASCWYGHFISEPGKVVADGPPYSPGDILYVRETWSTDTNGDYVYRTNYGTTEDDSFPPSAFKWRPSIHMPRKAARIFLRVTNVRVERLQEITPEQIDAEGCKEWAYSAKTGELLPSGPSWFGIVWNGTIKLADRHLYGWEADPWVWVIEFERIDREAAE